MKNFNQIIPINKVDNLDKLDDLTIFLLIANWFKDLHSDWLTTVQYFPYWAFNIEVYRNRKQQHSVV